MPTAPVMSSTTGAGSIRSTVPSRQRTPATGPARTSCAALRLSGPARTRAAGRSTRGAAFIPLAPRQRWTPRFGGRASSSGACRSLPDSRHKTETDFHNRGVRVVAALFAALLGVGGLSLSFAPAARAAQPTSGAYVTDPTGDSQPQSDPRADITSASINYWRDAITVTVDVAQWTDPSTDPTWNSPQSGRALVEWDFDVDGDGQVDYSALLQPNNRGGLTGFVGRLRNCRCLPQSTLFFCNAEAVAVMPEYRISFPAGCIGSPTSLAFRAFIQYGVAGSPNSDLVPDAGFSANVSPSTEVHSSGGEVVDDWGGLHPFQTDGATAPSVTQPPPYWVGQNVVRGVAQTFGGGYVLDDWGGTHWYSASSGGPLFANSGPYWAGEDVARGIALMPDGGGGYVLDDWGGLHPFAVADGTAPPPPEGGPYWLGQDVARGVVILPDGSGGYVVDDWGAFHPFVIPGPGHTMPPAPTDGPYWFGKDVVRGAVADMEGNGGYVVDDWGGIHTFSIPGTNGAVPAPSGGPYWPGQDVAHGISVVPQDPPPTPPPG